MSRARRLIRGTGIAVIAGLVLSACGGGDFNQSEATQVLQSVDVDLDSSGAITEVAGHAVYVDEISGTSDSSENTFPVEEVVDDLPVRVSTRYETDENSGTNLADLEGHTGRVNIEVTVENLTLKSSELTYDVAGESRQTPALVGTPLSIAGSTELDGTRASDLVLDSESGATTNGVVSQTSDGDAVVQWGTVLAPPQSEATTSFQLVADVEDFSAPEIDIAVQAGFHTDMSFEGMLTAAFDTSANSEYGMQKKAIELVAEVNDVLTRAGTTITEIRSTLDHTSETLGVDAAQQLRQNSDDMVTEMERVGEQLTALETQVDNSMSGAETAMSSQLSQIVASMNSMMGNIDAQAPQLKRGQGCAATVEDLEANGSLYSTFLILGAQLDGYAQANADCRNEVVVQIEQTLGPEVPNAELCEGSSSITCTLFDAQLSVQDSLTELVESGKENVQRLVNEKVSDGAVGLADKIGEKITSIREILDPPEGREGREDRWGAVEHALKTIEEIAGDLQELRAYGDDRIEDLKVHTEEIKSQQSDIADELCTLLRYADSADDLRRKGRKINDIHEDLVGEPCIEEAPKEEGGPSDHPTVDQTAEPTDDATPDIGDEEPSNQSSEDNTPAVDEHASDEPIEDITESSNEDGTGGSDTQQAVSGRKDRNDGKSLNEQMEDHLDEQQALWDKFLHEQSDDWKEFFDELGYVEEVDSFDFDEALGKLQANVKEARKGINGDAKDLEAILDKIDSLVGEPHSADGKNLSSLHADMTSKLRELETEFVEDANNEFDEFEKQTSQQLPENIDKQVRIVTDRVNTARDSVIDSYNSTIAGLATTSGAVKNGTARQLDKQKSSLEGQQKETTSALSESTSAVIESIHGSTASSTRDLEGASAQLGASLSNVILDLGDPDIEGSGILGSMSASSAMSDTADYQLALASQRASGYANVRSEDIGEIMLRQAQFSASLEAANALPAFHLEVPSGARSQTIYAFHIGGGN